MGNMGYSPGGVNAPYDQVSKRIKHWHTQAAFMTTAPINTYLLMTLYLKTND